jgi:hypothetical protein
MLCRGSREEEEEEGTRPGPNFVCVCCACLDTQGPEVWFRCPMVSHVPCWLYSGGFFVSSSVFRMVWRYVANSLLVPTEKCLNIGKAHASLHLSFWCDWAPPGQPIWTGEASSRGPTRTFPEFQRVSQVSTSFFRLCWSEYWPGHTGRLADGPIRRPDDHILNTLV